MAKNSFEVEATFKNRKENILVLNCGNDFLKQALHLCFKLDDIVYPDMEVL